MARHLAVLASLLMACGDSISAKGDPPADLDADGDGWEVDEDCDDADPQVHPDAAEVCNDRDDDCDGLTDVEDPDIEGASVFFTDSDGDGYGDADSPVTACEADAGWVEDDTDCDDSRSDVHPGASESCLTVHDDDCDGDSNDEDALGCEIFYPDADGDGFGGPEGACVCLPDDDWPEFYSLDCDDTDDTVHPDAAEVCDDGVDNDCDGTRTGCAWAGDTSLEDSDGRVLGVAADDAVGSTAHSVGDQDGDGYGDALVMAPGHDGGLGLAAFVAGPVSGEVPITSTRGQVSGVAGSPLTQAAIGGDLDGDGVADVLLGSTEDAGAVWVWYGPVTGASTVDDLAVRLWGDAGDQAGLPAGAGDMDGDGMSDIAVSALDDFRVYLVFGPVTASADVGDVGHALRSSAAAEAMAGMGDTNGDGLADLVIGSAEAGSEGTAWIVLGPGSSVTNLSNADGVLTGEEAEGLFGASVAAAGDHDGDGYDDLLVGAPGVDGDGNDDGAAYLFLGPVTGEAVSAHASFIGEYSNDFAGSAVGGQGDVDGDGSLDLAISAPGNGQISTDAGLTYIMYGPLSAGSHDLKFGDAFFEARELRERSGTSLGIASDMDGDGIDDVLVGAPGYDGGGTDAGSVEFLLSRGL